MLPRSRATTCPPTDADDSALSIPRSPRSAWEDGDVAHPMPKDQEPAPQDHATRVREASRRGARRFAEALRRLGQA